MPSLLNIVVNIPIDSINVSSEIAKLLHLATANIFLDLEKCNCKVTLCLLLIKMNSGLNKQTVKVFSRVPLHILY